jgi:hypothetical protein
VPIIALPISRMTARCEIAGIEPTVTEFEGDDPRAFILSMNLKRRHMSAGFRCR